jgi:hypothetical protein
MTLNLPVITAAYAALVGTFAGPTMRQCSGQR